MQTDKILLAEHDRSAARFLAQSLSRSGYQVVCAEDGRSALSMAVSHCPDCVLMDPALPDMAGNDLIRELRSWSGVPILVLSDCATEPEKAETLDLGADDYLTRPFGMIELLARIRTALRHRRGVSLGADAETVSVGALRIDQRRHRVYMGERDVGLTPQEFRILALLGRHQGSLLTYRSILCELWGPYASRDNKILRVHMASIRRKVEPEPDHPRYILTEPGVGYRLADAEEMTENTP